MSRYLYYRIYTDDGAVNLTSAFSDKDKTLGRIDVSSITPPHTVRSVKHRIAGEEGLIDHDNITLYLRLEEDLAAQDSDHINLYKDDGYGSSPIHAIGLVVPASSVPKGPKGINLAGAWRTAEIANGTRSNGVVTFTMTSPTTFIGTGIETDTYTGGGQRSYSFNVVDGAIYGNGQVYWLCDSGELNGKWSVLATPASNGLTMSGAVSAVSGNTISMTGTYTRVP